MRSEETMVSESGGKIARAPCRHGHRFGLSSPLLLTMMLLSGCVDESRTRHSSNDPPDGAACTHAQEASSAKCSHTEVSRIGTCPSAVAPIASPYGRFPFSVDSEFQARFVVAFVIRRDGSVESPRIASTDWRPGPNIKEGPKPYQDAVLASVSRWKYPPRDAPCRHELPFEVSMGDADHGSPLPVD
ncbi:hypothetical protein [Pseudoxanthomonas mexicana]|uniref:hypothetical protein n=1 Tax=Pseudoxanthomonas mexicana TaxID=128785 RepID=UPI0028A9A9C4|nr:hypothetical protein [Pseudoxanthomonas mexicana]